MAAALVVDFVVDFFVELAALVNAYVADLVVAFVEDFVAAYDVDFTVELCVDTDSVCSVDALSDEALQAAIPTEAIVTTANINVIIILFLIRSSIPGILMPNLSEIISSCHKLIIQLYL